MKNRITNDEFQENLKKDEINIDLKIKEFKNRIVGIIKKQLLTRIDIRESIQKEEMMNTVISDQQSNEWNFFRKIVNDL